MRSPRGWGSILPHSGGFRASIYISGHREQKVLPTKPEAGVWLKTMRARKLLIEAGATAVPGLAEQVRFRELEEPFTQRLELGFKKPPTKRTLDSYTSDVRELMKWWGPRRVSATSEREVQAYTAQLRAGGSSTSTIRHRLDRLAQLIRYAVEQRLIAREPCRVARPGITLKSRPEAVAEADLSKMVKAARGNALAVILLASDAGLRRDEIRRLRVEDVTHLAKSSVVAIHFHGAKKSARKSNGSHAALDTGHVHVAVRGEGDRTKSGKGRDVPILTARLGRALRSIDWKAWPKSAWSVATVATAPWSAAGLPGRARLHALRHRFVTSLLTAGVPLARVQGWAGHSTPAVTMRYSHLDPLDVPRAAYKALAAPGRITPIPRGNQGRSGKAGRS